MVSQAAAERTGPARQTWPAHGSQLGVSGLPAEQIGCTQAPPLPPSVPASGGPASGGPASGGPASGGPASGGPASGGPASGGPASGGPASGGPASGGPAWPRSVHGWPQPACPSPTQMVPQAVAQQHGPAPQPFVAQGSQLEVSGPPAEQIGCAQVGPPVPPSGPPVPPSGPPSVPPPPP